MTEEHEFILMTEYEANPLNPEEPTLKLGIVPTDVADGDRIECYVLPFATAIEFAFKLASQTIAVLQKSPKFRAYLDAHPELWSLVGQHNVN